VKRHHEIKITLLVAGLTLMSPGFSQTQTKEADPWVNGVTEFLLERANDNYMYIFERKLASNSFLNKYLPKTLGVAQAGDLRLLLTNRELWKNAVEDDLSAGKILATVRTDIAPVVVGLCAIVKDKTDIQRECDQAKEKFNNLGGAAVSVAKVSALAFRSTRRRIVPAAENSTPF